MYTVKKYHSGWFIKEPNSQQLRQDFQTQRKQESKVSPTVSEGNKATRQEVNEQKWVNLSYKN